MKIDKKYIKSPSVCVFNPHKLKFEIPGLEVDNYDTEKWDNMTFKKLRKLSGRPITGHKAQKLAKQIVNLHQDNYETQHFLEQGCEATTQAEDDDMARLLLENKALYKTKLSSFLQRN